MEEVVHEYDVTACHPGEANAKFKKKDVYELETVDHGVVVGYDGDRPVETAISGLTRVGNHSKYGFGELRVKPVIPDESNVKKQIEKPKSEH
jgi:hypothetical protein